MSGAKVRNGSKEIPAKAVAPFGKRPGEGSQPDRFGEFETRPSWDVGAKAGLASHLAVFGR